MVQFVSGIHSFLMTGLQYLLTAIKNITEKDIYLSTNVLEGYDADEQEV